MRDPSPAAGLRELIEAPQATLLGGCFDGISARLVQAAGFAGAHMSGFAVAASLLGEPDVGLLSFTEMAEAAGRLANALAIPLLADADTGYGGVLNIERTINTYMQRGVAGLHIEDQVAPKRCGHLSGTSVVPAEEMVAKIRASVAERERTGGDLVIVARTDARATESLESTLERGQRYRDAGADVLFVEALPSVDEVERVADALFDVALLFNCSEARAPQFTLDELTELGFDLVLAPITALLASAAGMQRALAELVAAGPSPELQQSMMSYVDMLQLVEYDNAAAREASYRP